MGLFPAAQTAQVIDDSGRSRASGVAKRRIDREQSWGEDSTPAKRAQSRLEERRKKNREMIALQKSKNSKSQAQHRQQQRQQGLKPGPSSNVHASQHHSKHFKASLSTPNTPRNDTNSNSSWSQVRRSFAI